MTFLATASYVLVVMAMSATTGYLIACAVSPFGTCGRCGGTGRKTVFATCSRCRGTGARLRRGRRLFNGFLDTRDRFTR